MVDGGTDSPAPSRDFFIRRARNPLLVLFGSACGINQMGVGIDEPGQHHSPVQVELFGVLRVPKSLDVAAWSNRRDSVVLNEQRPITNDSQVAQCAPTARHRPFQRQELRAPGNQQVRHLLGGLILDRQI